MYPTLPPPLKSYIKNKSDPETILKSDFVRRAKIFSMKIGNFPFRKYGNFPVSMKGDWCATLLFPWVCGGYSNWRTVWQSQGLIVLLWIPWVHRIWSKNEFCVGEFVRSCCQLIGNRSGTVPVPYAGAMLPLVRFLCCAVPVSLLDVPWMYSW